MSCGADTEANALLTTLLQGKVFDIPNEDLDDYELPDLPALKEPVPKLTIDALTTKEVDGTGAFDVLMSSMKAHLHEEYSKSRITGAEYTKAYVALVTSCLGSATQFLLQKDQTYWQAMLLQIQAVTAAVSLQTAKVEYAKAQLEAQNQEAAFGLTKIKIANESASYCLLKDELENQRPLQKSKLELENQIAQFNISSMLPQQYANLQVQENLLDQQVLLTAEQMEAARGQTSDTRTTGATILGSIGKQKELYSQQIVSYKRDSEVKVAKLFTDSWIAQKTIDEGLAPPWQFTNTSLDTILGRLKINNGLDG